MTRIPARHLAALATLALLAGCYAGTPAAPGLPLRPAPAPSASAPSASAAPLVPVGSGGMVAAGGGNVASPAITNGTIVDTTAPETF